MAAPSWRVKVLPSWLQTSRLAVCRSREVLPHIGVLPVVSPPSFSLQKVLKKQVTPGLDHLLDVLLQIPEIGFGGGVFGLVRALLGNGLHHFPGISIENTQGQVLGQGDGDRIPPQVIDLLPLPVQAEVRQDRVPEGLRVDAPKLGV